MKPRKLLPLFVLTLVITILLGAVMTTTAQDGTLQVWITWGDNPQQIQELFDRFGEANGVTVLVNAPVDDAKVLAGLAGTEPPHILVTGSPGNVGSWAREGLIAPLDEIIDTIGTDDMFPAPLGQCLYNGT